MAGDRIEQRLRLRAEPPLSEATVLVRGGPDTEDKLARHAIEPPEPGRLTASPCSASRSSPSWTSRSASCSAPASPPTRVVHLPTAARLLDRGFELLPTGLRPHYTVRLRRADNTEFGKLLAALGPPVPNVQYC